MIAIADHSNTYIFRSDDFCDDRQNRLLTPCACAQGNKYLLGPAAALVAYYAKYLVRPLTYTGFSPGK